MDRKKTLQNAFKQMNKSFNAKGTKKLKVIPTGSLELDRALGIGGFPKGFITEIYGYESSGKTTLALATIASCQRAKGIAAFIDVERSLDLSYAYDLDVDIEKLLVSIPTNGEQAIDIIDILIQSGSIDVIIVDSIAALIPTAELNSNIGSNPTQLQAKLISQSLLKLSETIHGSNTSLIFINQLRIKSEKSLKNNEVTVGGEALKSHAAIRLWIKEVGYIERADEIIGSFTQVDITKNILAVPNTQAEFKILYGIGVSD